MAADPTIQTQIQQKQGGASLVVGAGGTLETVAGATVTLGAATAQSGVLTLGGAAHDGLLAGSGTSSTKYTMTGASKSALSFYVSTADTNDSNRCAYMRLYLTGNGSGGEALRAFGTGSGTGLTALRGAHISASIAGSGTITGEMMPLKCTLHVPNTNLGGTCYGIQSEIYADGSSSNNTGTLAFIGCAFSGDATGKAALDDCFLLDLQGTSAGSGEIFATKTAAAVSHTLKIKVGGTTYYLMVSDAQ